MGNLTENERKRVAEIAENSIYFGDVDEDAHTIQDEFLRAKLDSDHPDGFKYRAGEIKVAGLLIGEKWSYRTYKPNDEFDEPWLGEGPELCEEIMRAENVSEAVAYEVIEQIF